MKRRDFAYALKNHDWYYEYSDDHRYYTAGREQLQELRSVHDNLQCPFPISELKKWAHDMIVGRFVEQSPGEWYVYPLKHKNMAPVTRQDLATQDEWQAINNWLEDGEE